MTRFQCIPLHVVHMTSRDGPAEVAAFYQEEVRGRRIPFYCPSLEVKPPEEEAALLPNRRQQAFCASLMCFEDRRSEAEALL